MRRSDRDLTLSLAGVYQACQLVKQIATSGIANNAIVESSLETLFKFDADSVEGVYGGVAGVATGIRTLREEFSTKSKERDMDLTRYVVSLLLLERKLSANGNMQDALHEGLEEIRRSLDYFSLMHENVASKLSALYQETISTLGPRVMVTGDRPYLDNPVNADKVRALLLAGIRSAVLWRQCGGSRWHILFSRRRYIDTCEILKREF